MCLAAVYLGKDSPQPLMRDIDHIKFRNDGVEAVSLLGEERFIPGKVTEIDFSTSSVFLQETPGRDKA